MASEESYCMLTTPEKDKATPEKAGIEEENATHRMQQTNKMRTGHTRKRGTGR